MLLAIGFLVSAMYWPGQFGAASFSRWALLYAAVPILLCTVRIRPGPVHWVGLAALAWVVASFAWTPVWYDGVDELAAILVVAGAFCVFAEVDDIRPLWRGLGLGMCLSSAIAVAQAIGYSPVVVVADGAPPSGLYVNPNVLGEAAAVVLVGLLGFRQWWLAAGVVPGLILSQSRGAAVALVACVVAYAWRRSRMATLAVAPMVAMVVFLAAPDKWLASDSLSIRAQLWADTADGLTFAGHGIGSFYAVFPAAATRTDVGALQPAHAHNDALEIIFEFGIGSALIFAWMAMVWLAAAERERLVLLAIACMAMVAFPLHNATTAFVLAAVAGSAARNWARVWSAAARRGP